MVASLYKNYMTVSIIAMYCIYKIDKKAKSSLRFTDYPISLLIELDQGEAERGVS